MGSGSGQTGPVSAGPLFGLILRGTFYASLHEFYWHMHMHSNMNTECSMTYILYIEFRDWSRMTAI